MSRCGGAPAEFYELELGLMMYKTGLITAEEHLQGVNEHSKSKRRIGDVFFEDLKLVPREHVEALARVQVKRVAVS